jgi:hypothetical protein
MANLILRQVKGSALTIEELDGNFEYFTGSYTNTGIITAVGFSGSFTGSVASASYATQALSSSYALTATSASYATNANNALTATSASYATNANNALTATSASYATNANNALTATSASYATNATNALTASYINPLEQDIQLTGSLIVDEGYIANFPTNSINLNIPSGYNALLIGPIYNSASINVSIGSRLVIL